MLRFNVDDLIHRWVNKLVKEEYFDKTGFVYTKNKAYKANENKLYCNDRLIAIHYKDYIFIETFNNTSSFGNGINSFHIISYAPDKSKVLISEKLLTEEILNDKNKLISWYGSHFKNTNEVLFGYFAYTKEFITNNRRRKDFIPDNIEFETGLPEKLYNKYKGILGKTRIKGIYSYPLYKGWSRWNTSYLGRININYTVRQLMGVKDIGYFLTPKELDRYNFKKWYLKYKAEDKYFTLVKAKEIYNNPEEKLKRENKVREIVEIANKKKKEKEVEENKKLIRQLYEEVEKWTKTDSDIGQLPLYYYNISNLVHQSIKLGKEKEYSYVVTSLNVRVPIADAKRALKLIRLCENNITYDYSNKNITIANYKLLKIESHTFYVIEDNQIVAKRDKTLIIGCHKIPMFEIERFLKDNNLNW